MRARIRYCLLATTILVCVPCFAVDGVVEINQAKALAGGVTPGDTPGYPVVLDVEGSYRLTGDLVVTTAADGIQLDADNITLDLNGFTLRGPVVCAGVGAAVSCAGTGGVGIRMAGEGGSVSNGVVVGFETGVADFGAQERLRLADLRAMRNGNFGVGLGGSSAQILRVVSFANENLGFTLGPSTSLIDSEGSGNLAIGATFNGSGTTIRNSVFTDNAQDGVALGGDCDGFLIVGSMFAANGGHGVSIDAGATGVGLVNNVMEGNTNGALIGPAIELGTNICDGDTTCP